MVLLPAVIIVILLVMQIVFVSQFNRKVYSVSGVDEESPTYLDMEPRDDSTSSWLKRDFEWEGKTLDLQAQTIDGVLHNNNSKEVINNWTIRIEITDDCFINNAWCGTMEIHQNTKEGEKVQTLDLRKYDLDEVKLDYTFDGDLLIPLHKGDSIIYYPSEIDDEIPISGGSELTMGVIFYYFDTLDFYDYTLDYTYHRLVTQGPIYYVMIVIGIFLLIGIAVYIASVLIYRDAERQMNLKKSTLSTMSDIYQSIYIIDLEKDTLTPVFEQKSDTIPKRPELFSAGAQIRYLFEADAEDAYKDVMIELCDLSTLPERMKNRHSLAGEYISKSNGWCSIRFFAMDEIEGRELDRVVFTVQVIDAEKREMDAITEKISRVERENKVNASFLKSLSEEMHAPVQSILDADSEHQMEKESETAKKYVRKIRHEARILDTMLSDLQEYSKLESDQIRAEHVPFSLSHMISETERFAEAFLAASDVEFKTDIRKGLPERIAGDERLLLRVLHNMISVAFEHTQEGSICFSVFGKKTEDKAHLVFSIRDNGDGEGEEKNLEIGLLLAQGLLLKMKSQLQVIRTPGIGTEAFFELETEVSLIEGE